MREKYADRIEAILASHIDGFRDNVIARKAYSPADLETLNINLGRRRSLRRLLRHRPVLHVAAVPRLDQSPHPVARLHHIGASTHPGPGLGGGSGYLVAKELG